MQLNNRKTNSTFKKWAEDSNRNYYKDDRQIDNKHEKMLGIIHYLLLFSHSITSNSLWPHGLQHTRLPCPSLSSGIYSNSCPLSHWCHTTLSSSIVPFSSCPQSFPASGSFPMSHRFASGGQSIGASASDVPINIQGWFPLGLTGLILVSKGTFL